MIKSAEEISIITPTYKRSNNVKAFNYFGNKLIIACHECEEEEYKKFYKDNKFLIIPNDLKGNMAKVRNFIYDNCPTKYLIMVDDDVEKIVKNEKLKTIPVDCEEFLNSIAVNMFVMCEEVGTKLWGINLQSDPKFYRQYSPFSFLQVVLGPFGCHIIDKKAGLKYDERLGLNEDYDFALQVLQKYHKIIRFNKYSYIAGHLTKEGGCGAYRTFTREKEQAKIMIKKWGSKIVKYDFNKSTNPRIHIPIKGI